jgi:Xaa-Pro aminopeptidase
MKSYFTSKFFVNNRQVLRAKCGGEPVVITANGLLQRGSDSAYAFTQDANFWYLTGLDEPDIVLFMDSSEEFLILPEQSDYQKVFDGSASDDELARRSGIKKIYDYEEGWERLEKKLKKVNQIATIAPPPVYIDLYGMYTNPARTTLVEKVKRCARELKFNDLAPHLANQRMIKQPEEIAAIQKAIDITAASLMEALSGNYEYEYQLEAEITAGFRKRGATGHAFEPIVAAGKRACILHNVANNAPIGKNELVVVDVGAEFEHYSADITRTVSFERSSTRQGAVYSAVLEAQEFAIDLLKPGLAFEDYRRQTDRFIGEKLRELGLIKTVGPAGIRKYYPHSISHFMGLNVHDVGDYGQSLQSGMVLTVEPGIYIPEEGLGVRLEDDILVTEKGCEILSKTLPKRLG